MTIRCKVCKCAITSIGPPHQRETEQVMELMARHLVSRHKDKALTLKQDSTTLYLLLSTYLMITRYVDVPPAETVLLKAIQDGTQALLTLFAEDVKPVA